MDPFSRQPLTGQVSRNRQEIEAAPQQRVARTKAVTTVTNSNSTLWTVTDNNNFYVQDFAVCNIAGGAITVTVYLVPSGGSAANGNKVYDALAMATNTTTRLDALIGHILEPGDALIAVTSSATGANFWLSGYEATGGDFI